MKIILDGIVESIGSRMDGSVCIKFATQELDSTKAGELFQLRGKYSKCLLSDTNITKLEEELVDNTLIASNGKQKTPSARLRACLWRAHEQSGLEIPFDDYYKTEMEKIIESVKLKLN